MLSIGKLAAGAEDYYLGQVVDGREEYYTQAGETPGTWIGHASRDVGLAGDVEPSALRAVLGGLEPTTGTPLADSTRRVPGFDLTFSAPKSVSLLHAFGSPEVRREVVEAHDHAVAATIEHLEREACTVRRGHAGSVEHRATGFVAAAFRHRTSRAGDPQLHTHVLVANLGLGPDGRWSALRGRHLYTHARTGGFLYQAHLRHELTARLGIRWHTPVRGMADIDGIDRRLIDVFSERRVQITAALATLEASSGAAAQVAALATRPAKPAAIDDATLHDQWTEHAALLGLDPTSVATVIGAARSDPQVEIDDSTLGATLTAQRSTFDRRDVLRAIAEQAQAGATVRDIDARADAYLVSHGVIALPRGRFTTREILTVERAVIATARARQRASAGVVDRSVVDAAIEQSGGLSHEQERLVRRLVTSGRGVEVVVGVPGSGKTHALRTAHDAWTHAGCHVVGVALAARAAKELEAGSGIPATTIARFELDLEQSRASLPEKCVLVVDEAGMVGTRTLARLLDHAAHAKVVLVGDPHQLPEIEAGGAFAALARQDPEIALRQNRRQAHAGERQVLAELRAGRASLAVHALARHGRITISPDVERAHAAMVDDWLRARDRGADTLMLASRRSDVAILNATARSRLVDRRVVDRAGIEARGVCFGVGDRVMTLVNRHPLGVTNGSRGTITNVADGAPTVAFDEGTIVTLPASYLRAGHLAHAYATTIHKAQGVTLDQSLVLADDALFRESAYTALSRGRDQNRLYLIADPETDAAHHEPAAPARPLEDLARILADSHAQHLAIDDAGIGLEL